MKILLLTSNYPADDIPKDVTPVVHYFAKEWTHMGHEVLVIHNQTVFPRLIYPLLRLFKKVLMNVAGFNFVSSSIPEKKYELDGVKVCRLCIKKRYPNAPFSKKSYLSQEKKIKEILQKEQFVPELIIGHWLTPQLRLVCDIRKEFAAKTAIIIHEYPEILNRDYGKKSEEYLKEIDVYGFRAVKLREMFKAPYPSLMEKPYFICHSGVPEKYLETGFHVVKSPLKKFTFVGSLVKRKYPECLMEALKGYHDDFVINYIGSGPMESNLRDLINKYDLTSRVKMFGRIPRDKVNEVMNETDCFIMISKDETFGLVYLEAMAHGCITIGAEKEGIDGVIVNGENGFLCEAGNADALRDLINRINHCDADSIAEVSRKARLTAMAYTNYNVAKKYLENVNDK